MLKRVFSANLKQNRWDSCLNKNVQSERAFDMPGNPISREVSQLAMRSSAHCSSPQRFCRQALRLSPAMIRINSSVLPVQVKPEPRRNARLSLKKSHCFRMPRSQITLIQTQKRATASRIGGKTRTLLQSLWRASLLPSCRFIDFKLRRKAC